MKKCPTCEREFADDVDFCQTDGTALRPIGGTTGDLVGQVIAERYRITKKLGEGGMGAVYLSEHVKMGRQSAIKVMTQAMAHDTEAIARFNREAANAASINHPNVCGIYDFGETSDGLIYLAMEFIEGEALTDLLDREGALTPARASDILNQAGDALQHAHEMHIVHRDLKPDNIMIARDRNGRDIVKLVDFGIAKAMSGEEGQQVTKTGLVVGTPEYMSPEQLAGDKLDGRSDIYSIALVFYRMITGTLPFQADTAQETMIKRLTDDPLRLNEALPGATFPDELQRILDKALARLPGERYDSAASFANEVADVVAGMKSPTQAGGVTQEATQLFDSSQVTGVSEGATAVADVPEEAGIAPTRVGGSARAPTPDTMEPQASPSAPAAKKAPVGLIAASVVVLAVAGGSAMMMLGGADEPQTDPANTVASAPAGGEQPTAQDSVRTNTSDDGQGTDNSGSENQTPVDPDPPDDNTSGNNQATPGPNEQGNNVPAAPDSVEVDNRIFELADQLLANPSNPQPLLDGLTAVYNDPQIPGNLRADAAFNIAAHWITVDRSRACEWYDRAIRQDENRRDRFESMKDRAQCGN